MDPERQKLRVDAVVGAVALDVLQDPADLHIAQEDQCAQLLRVGVVQVDGILVPIGELLEEVREIHLAAELRNRLIDIFRRDANGRRPVFGNYEKMQTDPHFKDYLLFHEYYDGDTGRGLGASHQTGWSALIANMIAELYE